MSGATKSNADFHVPPQREVSSESGTDAKSSQDEKRERKLRDVEENVRGNKGLAEARTDRGFDGSETEAALKRATEEKRRGSR